MQFLYLFDTILFGLWHFSEIYLYKFYLKVGFYFLLLNTFLGFSIKKTNEQTSVFFHEDSIQPICTLRVGWILNWIYYKTVEWNVFICSIVIVRITVNKNPLEISENLLMNNFNTFLKSRKLSILQYALWHWERIWIELIIKPYSKMSWYVI